MEGMTWQSICIMGLEQGQVGMIGGLKIKVEGLLTGISLLSL